MNNDRKRLLTWLQRHVEDRKFGLKWIDEKNRIFRIPWMHKNNPAWREEYCQVFKEWSVYTNMFKVGVKWSTLKTRLRTALNKLPDFQEMTAMHNKKDPPFPYKAYRFVTSHEKKRDNFFSCFDNNSQPTGCSPETTLSPASLSFDALGLPQNQIKDTNDSSCNSHIFLKSPQSPVTADSPPISRPSENVESCAFETYRNEINTYASLNDSNSIQTNPSGSMPSVVYGKQNELSYFNETQQPGIPLEQAQNVEIALSGLEAAPKEIPPTQQTLLLHTFSSSSPAPMPLVFEYFNADDFPFLSSGDASDKPTSNCNMTTTTLKSQPSDHSDPSSSERVVSSFQNDNPGCLGDNDTYPTQPLQQQQHCDEFPVNREVSEFHSGTNQQNINADQGQSGDFADLSSDLLRLTVSDDFMWSDPQSFGTVTEFKTPELQKKPSLVYKIFYLGEKVKEGNIYENGAHLYAGQQMASCGGNLGHQYSDSEKIAFPDLKAIRTNWTSGMDHQRLQCILSKLHAGFLLYSEGANIYARRLGECMTRLFACNQLLGNIALDRHSPVKLFDMAWFEENLHTSPLIVLSCGKRISNKTIGKLLVRVEIIPVQGKELQETARTKSLTGGHNVEMLSNSSVVFDSEDNLLHKQMSGLSLDY